MFSATPFVSYCKAQAALTAPQASVSVEGRGVKRHYHHGVRIMGARLGAANHYFDDGLRYQ